ncbi:hypothetical protein ACG94X_06600 [Acinetobacter sp. ULE_I010]|uniref:hypothetical protein n=1 Tax=Acinetobacter sp. ULE_I010 TaxID=3373065 RepID=UPI003AF4C5A7
MAYFAVYDMETGAIHNIVECPEFLAVTIHFDENQNVLQVDRQLSQLNWLILKGELVEKN